MAIIYRKFGDKKYALYREYRLKKDAENALNREVRGTGAFGRITKTKDGYRVWYRQWGMIVQ